MDLEELSMLLETMDQAPVSQEDFLRAADRLRSLSQSSPLAIAPDQQLLLYALYKQASEGDAPPSSSTASSTTSSSTTSSTTSAVASQKTDAWRSVAGIPREAAAKAYLFLVTDLEASLAADAGASTDLGDHGLGSVFSSLVGSGSAGAEEEEVWQEEEEEALFAAIAAGDCSRLQALLSSSSSSPSSMLHARVRGGLTALHYAADRGVHEGVRLLLAAGAAVHAEDDEGRTPLAYALLCDHVETARLLIEAGARVAEALSQAQVEEEEEEEELSPLMAALIASTRATPSSTSSSSSSSSG
eukprot:gene10464-11594_t